VSPQPRPGVETAIVIVTAPKQLLDDAPDMPAKQRAQQLAPAPADLAFMLNHDELEPPAMFLLQFSTTSRMRR
jgi:hypothetical protein